MVRTKQTARKMTGHIISAQPEVTFYTYRMKPTHTIGVFLTKLHQRWNLAHTRGLTHIDAINYVLIVIPEPWKEWARGIAPNFYHQLWEDGSRGDLPTFIARIVKWYLIFEEPPAPIEDVDEVSPASPRAGTEEKLEEAQTEEEEPMEAEYKEEFVENGQEVNEDEEKPYEDEHGEVMHGEEEELMNEEPVEVEHERDEPNGYAPIEDNPEPEVKPSFFA